MTTTRRLALLVGFMLALVMSQGPVLQPVEAADGLPKGDPRGLGFDPETLDGIEGMLREAVEAGRIAGGSALVARRGEVAWLGAVGHRDIEADRAMTEDTIVRIASMTKPVTSVAVMILVDEGKIRLDDPVSKYLPEFAHPTVLVDLDEKTNDSPPYEIVPTDREITIHQLLTHTSGLSYRFFDRPHLADLYVRAGVSDGLVETPGTIGDNAWRIAQVPLLHPPGSAWEYSLSIDVLGRIVEVASGRSLDDFFRSRIFEPLGMEDTYFILPEAKRDRLAAVYTPGEDGRVRRLGTHPVQDGPLVYSSTYSTWDDSTYYSGGAGLVSTLGDYARFLQMLLNQGELDGHRILQPRTVDRMTRNQVGDLEVPDWGHGDGFGYGFAVITEKSAGDAPWAVGSYSWGGFFYTYFWVDPRNELIGILFTQTYPSGGLQLREEFRRLTYEALAD